MTNQQPQSADRLEAIESKRLWIVVTSVLALAVLGVAFFHAPGSAVVVLAIIILVGIKKAAVRYRELHHEREALQSEPSARRETRIR